jgi:outer membrane cobalamin receptor
MLRHGPRTGVLATSIGALIATGGLSTTALGQDETDEEEAVASDDAIVVTGTRIRRNDFTSTNATITVTAEDMRNLGVTSVAEMVNQLPSNVAEITPETGTDSTFNMGASVANLRGLNANGGSRTLVLVDSRRVIGSNSSGVVDMNMIPTALV